MKNPMTAKRTLANGATAHYRDWFALVQAEADRANLSEAAREIANSALLVDAWAKGERPDFIVAKLAELAE